MLTTVLCSGWSVEGERVFLVNWGMEYQNWVGAVLVSVSPVLQEWPWSGILSDQEYFLS